MFDQHVHSSFSFDSNEDLENYINVSNNSDIITTEHLDFENPIINYKDSSIDYLKYVEQIKNSNKKYSNKFFFRNRDRLYSIFWKKNSRFFKR